MRERSGSGAAQAFTAGIARTAAAPAVFAGTLALTLLIALRQGHSVDGVVAVQLEGPLTAWIHGIGPLLPKPWPPHEHLQPWFTGLAATVTWIVFWAFLSGGALDRYARNRATRGRGFFAACAGHFPAMLRLGIIAYLINAPLSLHAVRHLGNNPYVRAVLLAGLFGLSLLLTYSRVRLVVEDRRSAIGALLAAARFIRRNPASAGLHAIYALLATAILIFFPADSSGPAATELFVAVHTFLILASWASAIALFQARLAHASYTAGPSLEWPESPAAEAIANLAPSATS